MKNAFILFMLLFALPVLVFGQNTESSIKLGAYYFDGWKNLTNTHLTKKLVDSFSDRKPIWGWVTSEPNIVVKQIDVAANAGISFFSFCWYYNNQSGKSNLSDSINKALGFYLQATNKNRLGFCLLVANHEGYIIGPKEWPIAAAAWIKLFKDNSYLKVDGKPYLSFFSVQTLVHSFGSPENVHKALDSLQELAKENGLKGVSFAACVSPNINEINVARACGFNILTGYNYPAIGFQPNKSISNVDSLTTSGTRVWNSFKSSSMPYVPVATLNWDNRPWNLKINARRYEGFSSESIYKSVVAIKQWISLNSDYTTKEKIALLYAWNEYGEGAWLTPSSKYKNTFLESVKRGLETY